MSGSRHDWLDDETAERLLSGASAQRENGTEAEFPGLPALAELLSAARAGRVEQAGEEAAVAAFRGAHAGGATHRPARARRAGALRRLPGSVKVAVTAAFAATALVGGVAAAAGTGMLPLPFGGGASAPDSPSTVSGTSGAPSTPGGAGSPSGTAPGSGGGSRPGSGDPSPSGDPSGRGGPSGGRPVPGSPDADALCRAYLSAERSHGRGRGMGRKQWDWLSGQAGGDQQVDPYCRGRLDEPSGVGPGSVRNTAPVGAPSAAASEEVSGSAAASTPASTASTGHGSASASGSASGPDAGSGGSSHSGSVSASALHPGPVTRAGSGSASGSAGRSASASGSGSASGSAPGVSSRSAADRWIHPTFGHGPTTGSAPHPTTGCPRTASPLPGWPAPR